MHLKFGYCALYTPIYRLTEEKKRFHVQKWLCAISPYICSVIFFKIYYVTCFRVMVFCNKCPLSITHKCLFLTFVFLQVKVVPFLADEQIT